MEKCGLTVLGRYLSSLRSNLEAHVFIAVSKEAAIFYCKGGAYIIIYTGEGMNNLFNELEKVLKEDERFISQDGKLMRNAVYEAANKMDESLLVLLTNNESIKKAFFKKINGVLVFDKQEFSFVINNRELLPDSYTRFKQKIGLVDFKNEFIVSKNDVVLSFPFKDCLLEFDSTDPNKDRKEVFYNETLVHEKIDSLLDKKVFTNAELIDKNGEKEIESFDDKSNLLIKGNNLLAMYSLLPRYRNQIKLMYWDVLYNTESDKVPYADSFKHSSWLVMMKNRLEVAKQLLKDDGVICIQCDDNEMAYLKVLMDEIFKRENFINNISVNMSNMSGQKINNAINGKRFPKLKETILIYAKDKEIIELLIPKINKKEWDDEYNKIIPEWKKSDYNLFEIETVENANIKIENYHLYSLIDYAKKENIELNDEWKFKNSYRIFATKPNSSLLKKAKDINFDKPISFINNASGGNKLIITDFNKETTTARIELASALLNNSIYLGDNWTDIITTGGVAQEGGVVLQGGKKPEKLLKRIVEMGSVKGDIVLDAYFGTGTTGAVAMKMNRQFIGIEQLDSHIELAKKRLKNVIAGDETGISKQVGWNGGGSFVYFELKKLNQQYIDKIESINDKKELSKLAIDILHSDFISCNIDVEKVVGEFKNIEELEIEDLKKILIELLDKNQLYVNYGDIDDEEMKVSDTDKNFTKSFYGEE